MSKWIIAICLAGMMGGIVSAAETKATEVYLSIDPAVAGVSVIQIDADGKKTVLVTGALSIDEAIREAMIRTGKPLMLRFGAA